MSPTSSLTLMTPSRLLRSLRKNPVILQALLQNVSPSQVSKSPSGPNEWSMLEVLCHLRDYEEIFFERTRLILGEECPHLPLPEESASLARKEQYQQQDFTAACASFFAARQTLLLALSEMSEEQWMRKGLLDGTTLVTLKEVVLQIILHDIDHIEQITHSLNS